MRNLNKGFENKIIEYEKLLEYGFILKDNKYILEKSINNNLFQVIVEISKDNSVSKVVDLATKEEYILVDVSSSAGDFVGRVKAEYDNILNAIIEKCTTLNIFKRKQAKMIIQYVKEKYKDDLEYLWKKFPNNAIWRNKRNNKWYGALLVVSENKLGISSDKVVEIIDLRYQKDKIKEVIDHNKILEGYHMNKNSWITIRLDESVEIEEIYKLIDNSYKLSLEK